MLQILIIEHLVLANHTAMFGQPIPNIHGLDFIIRYMVLADLVLWQLRIFLGFSHELSPANLWAGLSHMWLQTAFRQLG